MQVSEAAVIAMPHAKWVEGPLLVVKPNAGAVISKQDILAVLQVVLCMNIDLGFSMHIYGVSGVSDLRGALDSTQILCVSYVHLVCSIR